MTAIVRRLAPAALGVSVAAWLAATALPAAAAAGALDPSYGHNGIVTVASTAAAGALAAPSAMLVQPDGKILVINGSEILRFNPDGTPDSGFGNGGEVATPLDADVSLGADAALQPGGKIVVTGSHQRRPRQHRCPGNAAQPQRQPRYQLRLERAGRDRSDRRLPGVRLARADAGG